MNSDMTHLKVLRNFYNQSRASFMDISTFSILEIFIKTFQLNTFNTSWTYFFFKGVYYRENLELLL